MRQFIASAVIAAIVFTVASPTFAQPAPGKVKPNVVTTIKPAASTGSIAEFGTIEAVTAGIGVVIKWNMNRETRVAGYQVYRVEGSIRTPVGQFVLGSAGRSNIPSMYGNAYTAYDPNGKASDIYTIEALGVAGGSLVTQQFAPQFQRSASLAVSQADTLAAANAVNDSIESFTHNGPVASAVAPDLTTQQWVASQPGVKIAVNKEGLFRVTRAELQAAGFSGSGNSANWRLFMEGNEQPIIVGAGDQYIEFYGKGYDTVDTDTRIYYLLADTAPGARMQTHVLNSTGGTAFASTSLATANKVDKSVYMSSVLNGAASNFYGTPVIGTTPPVPPPTFTLPNLDTTNTGNASVTVTMHGFTDRDHTITLTVNGHALGVVSGSGLQQDMVGTFSVPVSFLLDGLNTLSFTASAPVGGILDIDLFSNISVQFPQKLKAFQNVATITTPGRRKVTLDGFSSPTISTVTIKNATVAQTAGVQTPAVNASPAGVLRLSAATYTAGTGGSSPKATITVSRVFGSTGAVGATLTLANGTATGGSACGSGADYVNAGPYTVSFGDGVTSVDVNVSTCPGSIGDPSGETFTATLSNPTGGATLPSSNIRVFDISYNMPRIVTGLVPLQSGNNFGVLVPSYRNSTLYAIDDSYAMQALSVTPNTPSTLSSTANAADMIIISYPAADFMAAAQTWANYRHSAAGGGFNVKVVAADDVYDEFGYGVKTSKAINDFLKFTYNSWQTKPKYVLLVGDASYDPRNFQGGAAENMVPTQLVDLIFEQSGSDEALADFNGDGLAEIAIGRIPAKDAATVNLILGKTQAQETAAMQSFSRGAVFVNDMPIGYDFLSLNQTLRNEIAAAPATFVSRDSPANSGNVDPNGNANIIAALNTGPFIVNYSGHGAANLWASTDFFNYPNLAQLTNPNQSFYTMLTCFNGLFLQVGSDCLAERLLKQPAGTGGASLTWASTTETTPDVQLIMGQEFYHQLGIGSIKRVGDLIADAKATVPGGSDVRYSWALLGDPATQIRP